MVDISKGTEGLNFPARASGKIFDDIRHNSAFLKAIGVETFHGDGEIIHAFGDVTANAVEETGEKTLSDIEAANVVVLPRKFYVGLPFSDELQEDHPEVVSAILGRAGSGISRKVDADIASSATITGFATLGKTAATPIATKQDLWAATSTLAGTDFGVVCSNSFMGYVRGLTTVQGNDAFDITIDANDRTTGTINGLPYYTFPSATPVAFVADWKANAVARKVSDVTVKTKYAGFDIDGVDIARRNMFVALVEQRLSVGINPIGNVVAKLVPATS